MTNNIPPHSLESERAVLGAVMLENSTLAAVQHLLEPTSFFDADHRRLYSAMVDIWPDVIDPVSLYEHCDRKIKLLQISKLLDDCVTAANVEYHAKNVANLDLVRKIRAAAQQIADKSSETMLDAQEYLSFARDTISHAGQGVGTENALASLSDGLSAIAGEILDGKELTGTIRTGLRCIDNLTGGLYSDLPTILAARPSMGKSALALNIALNVAAEKKNVSIFSLEDTTAFFQRRAIARIAGISLRDIVRGTVHHERFPDVLHAVKILDNTPIWICQRGMRVDGIKALSWAHKQIHGIDLLIVDHIGKAARDGNEYDVISEVIGQFANFAKELCCPVLLLCQLNRGHGQSEDAIPTLRSLRGSGHLEQDARGIWFLYRPWYYHPETEDRHEAQLIVAKNTHGATGVCRLWCDLSRMQFRDYEAGGEY